MTKDQCLALRGHEEIHYTGRHQCTRTIGPRGGETLTITRCRPSGRCQTWKTRPEEFRLPVKHGLYESSAITQHNCADFHLASECPLNAMEDKVNAKLAATVDALNSLKQ